MRVAGVVVMISALLGLIGCGDDESGGRVDGEVERVGDAAVAAEAARVVEEHALPAFAIARIGSDGSTSIGIAGQRSRTDPTALPLDAPFHLGSNTKAMTAALLATFVEDGALDLDARIADLLPDAEVAPSLRELTVRAVLDHRSGLEPELDLPRLHAETDSSAARREAVFDALTHPEHEPGSYVYANVNYMLAGVVAEQVGGATWEELLTERVFVPLGISCGFGAPTGANAPVGHDRDGEAVGDDDVSDNPAALGPAGTVHCTMRDWATFGAAMLTNLSGRDSPLMTAPTAADLFASDHEYVSGWARRTQGGERLYSHDGSNTLWYARIVLAPDRDTGILLASNTGERAAVVAMDELTQAFLER